MAEKTFEQSAAALEEIVRKLESGDVTLDESLKLFEEGMLLAKTCRDMLDNAQMRVKALVENADGTVSKQDFDTNLNNE